MRIAIINTLYAPYHVGGAEISVQLLAESFAEDGHDVHVITLFNEKVEKTENINKVTVHRMPIKNIYWPFSGNRPGAFRRLLWHSIDLYNPLSKKQVKSKLKEIQPDIVHTNNLAGFSVSAWDATKDLRLLLAHTSRDYYLIHPNSKLHTEHGPQDPNSIAIKAMSWLKRKKSQKIDMYIGISNYIRDLHLSLGFFKSSTTETIYNSISIPETSEHTPSDSNLTRIGFIGRLDPTKGLEELIRAADTAQGSFDLYIAGSGQSDYLNHLQSIRTRNRIHWLGHVKPADFFPQIDVLAVPSVWAEPLGRVVLEAYAYGTPVIGSSSGGIPEIIKENTTGFIFSVTSLDSIKAALSKSGELKDEATRMHCRSYATQFSSEVISSKYLTLFQRHRPPLGSFPVARHHR